MPSWRSIAREPLIHFVAIGAVLFAVDAWRSQGAAEPPVAPASPVTAPPSKSIVIDADVRTQTAANAQRRLGRDASAAELADETQRWIDEEVLYREALARGLERDDPVIHERIASRMSYVLSQSVIVPEPSEAELRAWFEQHRAKWSVAEHVDFTHVFVAGSDATAEARAADLEIALKAGAAPERLGDRFSGGQRYRGRKLADLAEAFGVEFVDRLAAQSAGTWVRRRSRHGIHLVRVDRVDAAKGADFAAARLDVRKDWIDAKRAQDTLAAMRRLRDGWTIEQR